MEPPTIGLLKSSVEQLDFVSRERKRDEVFKILENDKPWVAFELLNHFNILPHLGLGAIPDFRNAVSLLKTFISLSSLIVDENQSINNEYFQASSLITFLKSSRHHLYDHLTRTNPADRSIRSLDGLGALLWKLDGSRVPQVFDELALSRDEQDHLLLLLTNKTYITDRLMDGEEVNRRKIFQYFRSLESSGVDLGLLTLAEAANCLSVEFEEDLWVKMLSVHQKLFESWFEHPEIIKPKLLLTGRDLMFEFDLVPGPLIGLLLDELQEEQAAGNLQTKKEALEWVEGRIQPINFSK